MRQIQVLKSKIHNVEIVECKPDYIGSIEIPSNLMGQVGLVENELVHVWAISHKARIQTYVIKGEPDSGVKINGGAAHHFTPGDHVVIAAFCWTDERNALSQKPQILVFENIRPETRVLPDPLPKKLIRCSDSAAFILDPVLNEYVLDLEVDGRPSRRSYSYHLLMWDERYAGHFVPENNAP